MSLYIKENIYFYSAVFIWQLVRLTFYLKKMRILKTMHSERLNQCFPTLFGLWPLTKKLCLVGTPWFFSSYCLIQITVQHYYILALWKECLYVMHLIETGSKLQTEKSSHFIDHKLFTRKSCCVIVTDPRWDNTWFILEECCSAVQSYTHSVATLLGIPVQSITIQYDTSAINCTFTKLKMSEMYKWNYVFTISVTVRVSELKVVLYWTIWRALILRMATNGLS